MGSHLAACLAASKENLSNYTNPDYYLPDNLTQLRNRVESLKTTVTAQLDELNYRFQNHRSTAAACLMNGDERTARYQLGQARECQASRATLMDQLRHAQTAVDVAYGAAISTAVTEVQHQASREMRKSNLANRRATQSADNYIDESENHFEVVGLHREATDQIADMNRESVDSASLGANAEAVDRDLEEMARDLGVATTGRENAPVATPVPAPKHKSKQAEPPPQSAVQRTRRTRASSPNRDKSQSLLENEVV